MKTKLLNILFADDDIDDRLIFEKALKEIPIATNLTTVKNGEELMSYLYKNSEHLPDFLFLDLSMPRKTGFECLSEIKGDKKLQHLAVVIFSTSFRHGIDLEMNLTKTLTDMGAHDYVRKPSNYEQFKEVIHKTLIRAIEKSSLMVEQKNTLNSKNMKTTRVLLADDDIDDCNFFKKALETVPISSQLKIVHNGEDLMKYLTENSERLPHVLFLDINMPRKNGYECLAEIKQNEKLKDLPVVMYSTSKMDDKIEILFTTGANVYIRKPSDFTQLVQVIHHALPIAVENMFSNGKLKYHLNV